MHAQEASGWRPSIPNVGKTRAQRHLCPQWDDELAHIFMKTHKPFACAQEPHGVVPEQTWGRQEVSVWSSLTDRLLPGHTRWTSFSSSDNGLN